MADELNNQSVIDEHGQEAVNVRGLAAALQQFKTAISDGKVDKVSGKGLSTEDFTTALQTKLTQLYTKAEIDTLVEAIKQFDYEVAASLPTASADTMGTIYLIPSTNAKTQNAKDEFITLDNGAEAETRYTWEQIGTTTVDLTNYVQKSNTAGLLKNDGTVDTTQYTTNRGTVTGIKVGSEGSAIEPSSGVVTLPAYETNADVTDAENVKAALGTNSTHEDKFLRKDGTWVVPANDNTTYSLGVGTDADADKIVLTPSSGSAQKVTVPYATTAGSAPASDVSSWAKQASKPSYAYGEIGYEVATQTTSGAVTIDGTKPLHIVTLSGAATSVAFSTGNLPAVGHLCHVIFTASTATTVSIAHVSTGSVRYICPEGSSPADIDVPAGGYAEVDFLRGADTTESNDTIAWIYVRGV